MANRSFQQHGIALALAVTLLALAPALAHATGKYRSGITSVWFADAAGTPMAAIVYRPTAKANGAALGNEQFPAVVFMQGGNVDAGRYGWLQGLAEYGYIVVLPDKYPIAAPKLNGQNGINTNTKLTTVDVLDRAVKRLHAWSAEPSSPVFGRFDGQVAVAGHSLGGVVAITAVSEACASAAGVIAQCPPLYVRDPSIVAMWLIGGHFENPYGPPDLTPIAKPAGFPVYLIAGTRDGASTVAEVRATYARLLGPKSYYELAGANHFQWTEYLHPEDDLRTDLTATIAATTQQAATIDAARKFLDCHLRNDSRSCGLVPVTLVQ